MGTSSLLRSYDATGILGFGAHATAPLPNAWPEEIIVRYDGWSFLDLRDKCREDMHRQTWYERYYFSRETFEPGVYRLRLPIPGSESKTFLEQQHLLSHGFIVAPAVLIATALLVHRLHTGEDLLNQDWTRSAHRMNGGHCVLLSWGEGRLGARPHWQGFRADNVWMSSARLV